MLRGKLHCQNGSQLIMFSYNFGAGVAVGSERVPRDPLGHHVLCRRSRVPYTI